MYRYLIGGVVGAALGAAATYFYLQKKLEERLEAETEEIKEYYYEKFAKEWVEGDANRERYDNAVEEHISETEVIGSDSTDTIAKKAAKVQERLKLNKTPYNMMFDKASKVKLSDISGISPDQPVVLDRSDEVLEALAEDSAETSDDDASEDPDILDPELFPVVVIDESSDVFREEGPEGIYVITPWEFEEQFEGHEKITLVYYDDSATLATEDNEILVDILAHVGSVGEEILSDWFSEEAQRVSSGDSVYIRNKPLEIDYQVTWVDYAYDPD